MKALQRHAASQKRTIRDWIHRPLDPFPAARVGTKILDPDNLYHRYFQPVLSKAGLRKIRLHDLRRHVRIAADPERRSCT